MFDVAQKPRVYYVQPGSDFPAAVVRGIAARLSDSPPEDWARSRIVTNSGRMSARIREILETGPPRLLPAISLVTDLDALSPSLALNAEEPASALRRQLDIARMIQRVEGFSAPKAAFDIARSLAALLDELDGEDVPLANLGEIDLSGQSMHWAKSLNFIQIAAEYGSGLGPEALRRLKTQKLIQRWRQSPPQEPIVVVGSTGSRGTTSLLLEAVANLPQGALVLPGFDPNTPENVWRTLSSPTQHEDHPQYRYAALMNRLGVSASEVEPWIEHSPPDPHRNQLASLALRPAPVTHHWLKEGPKLGDLRSATSGLTLVEARDHRAEANAIALRMRETAEKGLKAALITPDRALTRRVSAALARWNLVPDDSAGIPLGLTAPGRLLGQLATFGAKGVAADTLVALLKHPLTATGGEDRGPHLLNTRGLELHLRRHGPPFPTADDILRWSSEDDKRGEWGKWLAGLIAKNPATTLPEHLEWLTRQIEALTAGPGCEGSGDLWAKASGRQTQAVIVAMAEDADLSDMMTAGDFATLLSQTLASAEPVREVDEVHQNLMIWGTLEARVQGADLIILGGLNDGIWPAPADPDPWMNRMMRHAAGLLSPERQIGLSAHDFQQALGAKEVWLTRATKSDDAETVPSRWLNRLTTLLSGLDENFGSDALAAMRGRAMQWLTDADRLDIAPRLDPSPRPSPAPPVAVRPRKLSVTKIRTLIRDPYAIYAQYVLKLKPLDPLVGTADARLRGIVLHDVMERLLRSDLHNLQGDPLNAMRVAAEKVLQNAVPWPAARALWLARFMRAAPWFLETEKQRSADVVDMALETKGALTVEDLGVTLTATADRIDLTRHGTARIYDYKTGAAPSGKAQRFFDKQLPLEAAMVERGAFGELGDLSVSEAAYISLGSSPKQSSAPLENADFWAEFVTLMTTFMQGDHGYTARRGMQFDTDAGDYDLLSRYGEWTPADPAEKVLL